MAQNQSLGSSPRLVLRRGLGRRLEANLKGVEIAQLFMRKGSIGISTKLLGDLDDVRTYLHKAQRAAALIYAHFKKEFGVSDKR
jgi:hypothetical protein